MAAKLIDFTDYMIRVLTKEFECKVEEYPVDGKVTEEQAHDIENTRAKLHHFELRKKVMYDEANLRYGSDEEIPFAPETS